MRLRKWEKGLVYAKARGITTEGCGGNKMLIRSQDKKALVDIAGMTVRVMEDIRGGFKIVAYGNNQPEDRAEKLGNYEAMERAIEVLTYIQNGYLYRNSTIFSMPEE